MHTDMVENSKTNSFYKFVKSMIVEYHAQKRISHIKYNIVKLPVKINDTSLKVSISGSRVPAYWKAEDIVMDERINHFSTLAVILITYLATKKEVEEYSCDHELVSKVTNDPENIVYIIKDHASGEVTEKNIEEIYRSDNFLKLPAKDVAEISYLVGYKIGFNAASLIHSLNNENKHRILETRYSSQSVEFQIENIVSGEVTDIDITELIKNVESLNSKDGFILGSLVSSMGIKAS